MQMQCWGMNEEYVIWLVTIAFFKATGVQQKEYIRTLGEMGCLYVSVLFDVTSIWVKQSLYVAVSDVLY